LVKAVEIAFKDHYPLVLTPDIIWITIAQGFAEHINNHAEEFRPQFVSHQGKKDLRIQIDRLPSQPGHWAEAVQEWGLMIRDEVGAELYRTVECNFTTTTPTTQTVSHIVLMDAFRQYFDYSMQGICGIPDITILGTVEDWQSIYQRVEAIAQYDLTWWTDRLLPICAEFIQAAAGKPTLEFWQGICKPYYAYGPARITGWITDLFPYVEGSVIQSQPQLTPNPLLAIAWTERTADDGIPSSAFPLGLSQVLFKLITRTSEQALELIAGFVGVNQHARWGALKPELGWAVVNTNPTHS
jgi:hypothetical protein